jgi:hypothetical protein
MNYKLLDAAAAAAKFQIALDKTEKKRLVAQQERMNLTENIRYLEQSWSRTEYRFGTSAVGAIKSFEFSGNEAIASLSIFELIDGKYFPKDNAMVMDHSDNIYCVMSESGICHFLKMTVSTNGLITWSKSTKAEMFFEQAQVMLESDNLYCRTTSNFDFGPNTQQQEEIDQEYLVRAKQEAILNEQIAANPMINIEQFMKVHGGSIVAQKGNAWAIKTRNMCVDIRDSCTTVYYTLDGIKLCYFSADAWDSTNTWNWFQEKEYDVVKQINDLV